MTALILVGGMGTRLRGVENNVPKPMVSINGRPFLEWVVRNLIKNGVNKIIFALGYKADIIKTHFNSFNLNGVTIEYSYEEKKLGTAGAIKNAKKLIGDSRFLVQNGDTIANIDYRQFHQFSIENKKSVCIAVKAVLDARRFGTVELASDKKTVLGFSEKMSESGEISTGIYSMDKHILDLIESEKEVSLEYDVLPDLCKHSKINAMLFDGEMIDIGTPESYLKTAENHFKYPFFN